MDVVRAAARRLSRTACIDTKVTKYSDLLSESARVAATLVHSLQNGDGVSKSTVGIMAPPGQHYVEATWGTWLSGGIAVPMCLTHPASELQYVLENSEAKSGGPKVLCTPTRVLGHKFKGFVRHCCQSCNDVYNVNYLLAKYDQASEQDQQQARAAAKRLRLTVSGSAACPLPVMSKWEKLSGEKLLERYGMTETGMVVSNPLTGDRRPGTVGVPLPGITVKVAPLPEETDQDKQISAEFIDGPGELLVKGDNLFKEYWRRPEATAEAFDQDGWFKTGDTAATQGDPPYWKILGRGRLSLLLWHAMPMQRRCH
ncbi:hypothetical protein WJX79_007385 [Trebouxia sp. C0005]